MKKADYILEINNLFKLKEEVEKETIKLQVKRNQLASKNESLTVEEKAQLKVLERLFSISNQTYTIEQIEKINSL